MVNKTDFYNNLVLGQGMLCAVFEANIRATGKCGKRIRGILPTFYLFYEEDPVPEELLNAYYLYINAIKGWKANNFYLLGKNLFELNKAMSELAKNVVVKES